MTREHYILIAEELNAARELTKNQGRDAENAVSRIIEGLATVLRRDNPRFCRQTFYRACGFAGK